MTIIDISQPLTNDIAVWPGDTPFTYEVAVTKEQTGSVNIGKLTMSIHTGTHIDAPFHFDNLGRKVVDLDLSVYVGAARVIDVSQLEYIDAKKLKSFSLSGVERLLLKSNSSTNPEIFPTNIPILDHDIAPYLHSIGVRLLGVDVPSVDPLDSKSLDTHHALFHHDIHILENIVLHHVTPGDYELIALPLSLNEADGSPVRAVLKSQYK